MKFKIKKKDIIEHLKIVAIIGNKKSNFYNIKNFIVEVNKEKQSIFLYSSNIDVSFQKYIPAEVEEEGSFSINSQKVFEVVKEINCDEIIFEYEKDQWLSIIGDSSKIKIPFTSKEEYSEISEGNAEKITNINSSILTKCLKKTIDFVSKDPIKSYLHGVNTIFANKNIIFFSSDSYVACRYIIEDNEQQKECKFIIPSRNITEIFSYLENEKEIDLYLDEKFFLIKGENSFLKSKLLEETIQYPKVEKYFENKSVEKSFTLSLQSLLKEIKLLMIILDEFSAVMKFSLENGKLSIESELMQTGQSKHNLNCNYEGENFSVGLNISQALKSLQNLEEFFKEINFSFQNDKIFVLKGDEKEDYKIVMMPMKINF